MDTLLKSVGSTSGKGPNLLQMPDLIKCESLPAESDAIPPKLIDSPRNSVGERNSDQEDDLVKIKPSA